MDNGKSGNSSIEGDGGKIIIATPEDFSKLKRPPCPACESSLISSRGIEWECKECGKRYLKRKRGIRYINKPNCVHCGSDYIHSRGPYWFCCDCFRSTRKTIQLYVKTKI